MRILPITDIGRVEETWLPDEELYEEGEEWKDSTEPLRYFIAYFGYQISGSYKSSPELRFKYKWDQKTEVGVLSVWTTVGWLETIEHCAKFDRSFAVALELFYALDLDTEIDVPYIGHSFS